MRINRITAPLWRFLKNPYPRPENNWLKTHIPGKEIKDSNNIKREDKEHFFPEENKTSNHLLQLSDFIKDATEELKKIFHEKWINDLFGKNAKEKRLEYYKTLVKAGIESEQVKLVVDYGVQKTCSDIGPNGHKTGRYEVK